jgi:hypothetical protein
MWVQDVRFSALLTISSILSMLSSNYKKLAIDYRLLTID